MITQVASSFIGDLTDDLMIKKLEGVYSLYGNIIHITDAKNDNILDVITAKNVIDNLHHKSLKDNFETFDFEVLGEKSYDEYLQKGNRIIIPGEDQNEILEFVIDEIDDIRDTHKRFEVRSYASYLDLKKAKVIDPFRRTAKAREHMIHALTNTEFQVGFVESDREITLSFDNHTNPFEYLKRIAREFDLELNFRVEHNGIRVTKRIVDAVDRVGLWRGREITFGKDLQEIKRLESGDIYTALIGLGPEKDDGSRLQVLVDDYDALQIWGRPENDPKHLIGVYEPESDREDMTLSELRQYTRTELNKRKNSVVNYEIMFLDLEFLLGHENKKIRFGDTISIKDIHYTPHLYIEARVFEMKRNVVVPAQKEYVLGDFVEYTEDEVKSLYEALKRQLSKKAGIEMLLNYAEPKKVESPTPPEIKENENPIWVNTSKVPHTSYVVVGNEWVRMSPTEPSDIGAYSKVEVDKEVKDALKDAKAYSENADNIKSGVIDVGAVPIRTSMTGARLEWDGVNGLVQYDMQGNPVSWINLEAEAYFKDAYLSGRVEAKEGFFGDNLSLENGKIQIRRPDGAITINDGMMGSDYSVSSFDPYFMDNGWVTYGGSRSRFEAFTNINGFYQAIMGALDGRGVEETGATYDDVRDSSLGYTIRFQRYEFVHSARYLRVAYRIANNSQVGKHRVRLQESGTPPAGYREISHSEVFEKGDVGLKNIIIDLGKPSYEVRDVDLRIGWSTTWNSPDEIIRFRINRIVQTDYV